MMGDDHSRIAAASKLAAKEIGCKVFKGSPYYRKEGVLSSYHLWVYARIILACCLLSPRHCAMHCAAALLALSFLCQK